MRPQLPVDVRGWLRWLPAAVVAVALVVLLARNADGPALPDYEVPEGFEPAPPPTTAAPGAVPPDLVAVGGTTTSLVPPNVGRARLTGFVTGPDGAAVVGAVVRIERVIAGTTQVVDAATGPDGRYDVGGIGGGRYRLRAFLAPTLAQPEGTVLFLPDGEERTVDLAVEAFGEPATALSVAPDPPLLGESINMVVRVTGRFVDPDGFVRTQPLVGGTVTVAVSGGWAARSPTVDATDGGGDARFSFECRSTAPAQATVTTRLPGPVTTRPADPTDPTDPTATTATAPVTPTTTPAAANAVTTTFDLPACVDPATLTTTTTEPPAGESTSTSVPDEPSTSTSAPPG